jgi:acyl-CoA thioesterase
VTAPALLPSFDDDTMRPAWGLEHAAVEPVVGGWTRTRAARPVDAVLLAALADAWAPAAFVRMDGPTFVPTLDLTVHWRSPIGDLGAHPWVLGRFGSWWGEGGTCEEDGELWSEDGVLLAQSRQLAIVRRAR